MERIKRKYTRKKKIEQELCWQAKERAELKEAFNVITKNVLWVNNGKEYTPYHYTEDNGVKLAVMPYAQYKTDKYITDGLLLINNLLTYKN